MHCSHTTPLEVPVKEPASQASSSLAVAERTLPQNLEHGELGDAKRDATSGALTTAVVRERRAAPIRIVTRGGPRWRTRPDVEGLVVGGGGWKDLGADASCGLLVNPARRTRSCGWRCGEVVLQLREDDYCRRGSVCDMPTASSEVSFRQEDRRVVREMRKPGCWYMKRGRASRQQPGRQTRRDGLRAARQSLRQEIGAQKPPCQSCALG